VGDDVSGGVVKVIELVASSPTSFDEAVRSAVRTAGQTLRNIQGVEVVSFSASVEGNEITNFKANCKVAFLIDSTA
jgi:hypothetical protein